MYQLCVLLLKFVRRYCVHRCGDSWYNLWRDMVGDAHCFPPPPPVVQPLSIPDAAVPALLERSLKIASLAQLLHTALLAEPLNLFDVEDIESYIATQLEFFGESLDQLGIEHPHVRQVTRISELYHKYKPA